MKKSNQGDIEFIEALAELLNSKDLGEIEVLRQYQENDTLEVRVAKAAATAVNYTPAPIASAAVPAAIPAPTSVAQTAQAETGEEATDMAGAEASPMVGTVYLAPEPGAAPFAKVGDNVEEGQTLLIIEAMKTMNQIPASKTGVLKRILVEDGSPVEFGDPLAIIE